MTWARSLKAALKWRISVVRALGKWSALLLAFGPATALGQAAKREMAPIMLGNPGDWFVPETYPADALRSGRQGRVVAAIGVDSAGRAVSCVIDVSSGTTSLDKGTCDIIMEHAAFNPATDRKGRPVASVYKLPVKRVLPDPGDPYRIPAATAAVDMGAEYQIVVDGNGAGVSCRTLSLVGEIGDPCKVFVPGRQVSRPLSRDGKPVGATITYRSSRHIAVDP